MVLLISICPFSDTNGFIITGSDEGRTSTPSYPGPYPPNSDLTWTINVDPKYRVTLTFNDFDLEDKDADGQCTSDVVVVYDGLPNSGSELGRRGENYHTGFFCLL